MEPVKFYAVRQFNKLITPYTDHSNTRSKSMKEIESLLKIFQTNATTLCKQFIFNPYEGIYQLAYLLKQHAIVDVSANLLRQSIVFKKHPPLNIVTNENKSMVIVSSAHKSTSDTQDVHSYSKIFADGNILFQAFQIFGLLSINSELTAEILNTMILLSDKGSNHAVITQRPLNGVSLHKFFELQSFTHTYYKDFFPRNFAMGVEAHCVTHVKYSRDIQYSASSIRATAMSIYYKCAILNGFVLLDGHNNNIYIMMQSQQKKTNVLVSQVLDINPEMRNYDQVLSVFNENIFSLRLGPILQKYFGTDATLEDLYEFMKVLSDAFLNIHPPDKPERRLISDLDLSVDSEGQSFDYCFSLLMLNNDNVQQILQEKFTYDGMVPTPFNILLLMGLCSNIIGFATNLSSYLDYLDDMGERYTTPKTEIESRSRTSYNQKFVDNGCLGQFYVTGFGTKMANIRSITMEDLEQYYNLCESSFSDSDFASITDYKELSGIWFTYTSQFLERLQTATDTFADYLNKKKPTSTDKWYLRPIIDQFNERLTWSEFLDQSMFNIDTIDAPPTARHAPDIDLSLRATRIYQQADSHVSSSRSRARPDSPVSSSSSASTLDLRDSDQLTRHVSSYRPVSASRKVSSPVSSASSSSASTLDLRDSEQSLGDRVPLLTKPVASSRPKSRPSSPASKRFASTGSSRPKSRPSSPASKRFTSTGSSRPKSRPGSSVPKRFTSPPAKVTHRLRPKSRPGSPVQRRYDYEPSLLNQPVPRASIDPRARFLSTDASSFDVGDAAFKSASSTRRHQSPSALRRAAVHDSYARTDRASVHNPRASDILDSQIARQAAHGRELMAQQHGQAMRAHRQMVDDELTTTNRLLAQEAVRRQLTLEKAHESAEAQREKQRIELEAMKRNARTSQAEQTAGLEAHRKTLELELEQQQTSRTHEQEKARLQEELTSDLEAKRRTETDEIERLQESIAAGRARVAADLEKKRAFDAEQQFRLEASSEEDEDEEP